MGQKLFRDPLYDYISIDKESYPWLLDLINCPEMQRLRYINQLGLSQLTYPGATHSRFSHSLGVLYLMKLCVTHLKQSYPKKYFKTLDEEALLAAALLHDIGHGPFSHATEELFGKHEDRTVEIILDKKTCVNKGLRRCDGKLPSKVAALISDSVQDTHIESWQKSLISSELDMDRLDYLRRDSLFSGAEYGNFDWFRIIHTMELREKELPNRKKVVFIVWPEKSKYAIEEYIFSRFYMYESVYFHHTTRGFECLLKKIIECAQDYYKKKKSFFDTFLNPMKILLTKAKASERFQSMTDNILTAQLKIWEKQGDETLKDLCTHFLERKVFGWEQISKKKIGFEITTKTNKVRKFLEQKGVESNYYFFEDKTGGKTYKPYKGASEVEDQTSANSIMLYDPKWEREGESGFREITHVPGLEGLKAITETDLYQSKLRYYFPKEYENKIKRLLSY